MKTCSRQHGVGMIEILVALLVITIGLVGATGMNAVGLKNSVTSMNRSNAMFLANSIAEKIRSTGPNSIYVNLSSPSNQSCNGASVNCTTDQLVTFYKSEWLCQLGAGGSVCKDNLKVDGILPDATGKITLLADQSYQVEITFRDTIAFNSDGSRDADGALVTLTSVINPN
ncbi:type IV pilus modification PilV family protein [Gynuella sp.]|uniref:type IV pilus modification PilV family protein n=1 Tax=Gynuella sp. TaxID=2969146 RepID=UPI003D0C9F33